VATTVWERMRGSIPFPPRAGEALLLPRTWWVHTLFMREPIDVVYLDRNLRVRSVVRAVWSWRLAPPAPGAWWAMELPAGAAGDLRSGETLVIEGLPVAERTL